MEPSFNLIDEPWIGAVDPNGRLNEYSLREVLVQAHELRGLHDDSPLVVASLLRMMLALLHRVHKGPQDRSEWQALWQFGRFDAARLDEYFAEWRGRFDLFDKEHPFYQTANEIGLNPISSLVPEAASGNNATLFDHQTEATATRLVPADAAKSVMVAQYFSLGGGNSGIKGRNFTDSTLSRGMLSIAEGTNLFQTLVFNLVPFSHSPLYISLSKIGIPAWEKSDPHSPDRKIPDGFLDYLTWQSRLIKLIATTDEKGKIRVKDVYRSQGLILDKEVELFDPAKSYQMYKDALGIVTWKQERAAWRDCEPLLRLQDEAFKPPASFAWLGVLVERGLLKENETLRFMALGLATESGKATVHFFRNEHLPLPLAYLDDFSLVDSLALSLDTAEKVASELWKATGTMASVLLAPDEDSERPPDSEAVRKLRDSMGTERRYWATLEPLFRQMMQSLPTDGTEAIAEWFGWLRKMARSAFNASADGLGDDPRALKATVRGSEQLERGLGKVLKIESGTSIDKEQE